MKLHEAIEKVLVQQSGGMTTSEIADEINNRKLYTKRDGSPVEAFQIHGRTRNYSDIFEREGSTVFLKNRTGINESTAKVKKSLSSVSLDDELAVKVLMNEKNFKIASNIENKVPAKPGFYCIRIKTVKSLPSPFAEFLVERGHNILYIGIASKSLKRRLYGQELRAKGHGTFFRSIGSVLGYRPEPVSLINKKNKRNYTFQEEDERAIIHWINDNLLVNWVTFHGPLNGIEENLIQELLPLFNVSKNPAALTELRNLTKECREIARGV